MKKIFLFLVLFLSSCTVYYNYDDTYYSPKRDVQKIQVSRDTTSYTNESYVYDENSYYDLEYTYC